MGKKIFMIAGESSGDLHGSSLAKALQSASPDLTLLGLGGSQMREAGVNILADPTTLAVVGLVEVLQHLGAFRDLFNLAVRALDEHKPELVILIDYPGFNLRFAREAKRRGIRLVYYISPQLWAWDHGRIAQIKATVDRMIVVLPFEQKLYEQHGVPVTFVGHPLLDQVKPELNRLQTLERLGLADGMPVVGLLPGSREGEVRRLLPAFLAACDRLQKNLPSTTRFLLIKAPHLPWKLYRDALKHASVEPKVLERWDYDSLYACDLVLVASGTATLECALLERPMLIIYKSNWLTYLIGRVLVRIPTIGLVNIVAGCSVVPELVQHDASPARIARATDALWASAERREAMKVAFRKIRASLGTPGASKRAAQAVLQELESVP